MESPAIHIAILQWLPEIVISGMAIILWYVVKHYLVLQERKYETLVNDLKVFSGKFIEVIEELKDIISDLKLNTISFETANKEQHDNITSHLSRVDSHIGSLYKKYNSNTEKIIQLEEKVIRLG